MHYERVPMLVRRFDPADAEDIDLSTEPGIPLPFGFLGYHVRLYVQNDNARFFYGIEEKDRSWVIEWINRDPKYAFWVAVDGVMLAAGGGGYNANTGKSYIEAPLKFSYRLVTTEVRLYDRYNLEWRPDREEILEPRVGDPEDGLEDQEMYEAFRRGVRLLLNNHTRFEAGEVVISTLCDQAGFRNAHILNEAGPEFLPSLAEALPTGTVQMKDVELIDGVRKRLALDLKTREAIPLNLGESRISEWKNISDVIDDVDWHMHIR